MAWITGVGLTRFGKHEGSTTIGLMTEAATAALADAGLERRDVDGLVCGYSTIMPHLMLSTLFAEHFGLQPRYAHGMQVGGATGFAMAMLASPVVGAGAARTILVVAGENRLTGQSRELHAAAYSATLHYLTTAAMLGVAQARADGRATIAAMKVMPTEDDCFDPGRIRANGRKLHPAYLFKVKTPQESTGPWDLLALTDTTPADAAFRPMSEGRCPLVTG